jgi:hypothetical protein
MKQTYRAFWEISDLLSNGEHDEEGPKGGYREVHDGGDFRVVFDISIGADC